MGPEAARGDIRPASIVGARENSANSDARAARGATRCGVSRVSRLPIPAGWASTGATCGRRTGMPERPAGPRYPGFPGASAPRHPGVPASRRPGVAASRRPGVPASRRPGIPEIPSIPSFPGVTTVTTVTTTTPVTAVISATTVTVQNASRECPPSSDGFSAPATPSHPERQRGAAPLEPRPAAVLRRQPCWGGSRAAAAAVRRRPCSPCAAAPTATGVAAAAGCADTGHSSRDCRISAHRDPQTAEASRSDRRPRRDSRMDPHRPPAPARHGRPDRSRSLSLTWHGVAGAENPSLEGGH